MEFSNFEDRWAKADTGDLTTSDAIHLIAKLLCDGKMKDDMYVGAVEGLHRTLSIIHFHMKSAPDYTTAILCKGDLTLQNFVSGRDSGESTVSVRRFETKLDRVVEYGKDVSEMLASPINVNV